MPKSKRARVVHLTKTESRGRARKSELMDLVQQCCDEYKTIYLFSCDNMRSNPLKQLRMDMKDSRFMYGRNKVMRLALGKTKAEAYQPGMEKLAEKLHSEMGLLFTNTKAAEVEAKLGDFKEIDFARAGFKADRDIEVKAGPIVGEPSSSYEPLRKLMLPVKLNKGVIELEEDHRVCSKGDVLTPEQAQALKFFNVKLAEFRVKLLYRFRDGELTQLAEDTMETEGKADEDDEDDEVLDEDDF
ncbi:60S acidic ribosomal protein P0 [Hondaea fermentalgiana]|uniref:Ribosome assembly factor mrt4 n=1 Tax=Hondaea fermentalgiana TaxID=2315210 RepID=A0A2R5GFB0_9STRA|nr:60S acidic ribosomal protein P0 [Hondaea fermentalgiana]|eukprot:GBG29009.1 60S acidic ribosomal protein P0 [Hondaea fermentalgiana]